MTHLADATLRIRGVSKRYGGRTALAGVDLDFRPGRVTAVLGPNGAGKTTLMKVVLGLVKPDAGDVLVGGRRVNGDAGYRSDVGYMPQLPRFPENLTGRELVALLDGVRGFRGEPDEELLDGFGLRGDLDERLRALSGGTRQKLNAALALRYGASLLLLDEPTASLDPVAARILKERVRRERDRGRTVLVTSHDLAGVQTLADDVVFLLDGRVRFAGSVSALLDATGEVELEGAVARLMLGGPGASGERKGDGAVAGDPADGVDAGDAGWAPYTKEVA